MNTAYISRYKGKQGLRFVCLCGSATWLRTNKQEYIKIDERKEVRRILDEMKKQISKDEEETRYERNLWNVRIHSQKRYSALRKIK